MTTKTSIKKTDPVFARQIAELRALAPESAAYLAACSASTLRASTHQIQPNAEGTYDAREVVQWVLKREPDIELRDDHQECLMMAAECAGVSDDDRYSASFALTAIERLRKEHGRRVDSMIVDELLPILLFRADEQLERTSVQKLSSKELVARHREELDAARRAAETRAKGVTYQCPSCQKIRRGRAWIEAEPGTQTISHECPCCNPSIADKEREYRSRAFIKE